MKKHRLNKGSLEKQHSLASNKPDGLDKRLLVVTAITPIGVELIRLIEQLLLLFKK